MTKQIMIGMFVAFGGVLFGYDTGTISGIIAMKYASFRLLPNKILTNLAIGKINSLRAIEMQPDT